MSRRHRHESRRSGIAAAAVLACFLLQHALVLIHVACHEHTVAWSAASRPPGIVQVAHGGAAHVHDHGATNLPWSDHEPHPVDDHLDQLQQPGLPSTVTPLLLDLPPRGNLFAVVLEIRRSKPVERQLAPRAPPLRAPVSPRAPPVAC